MPADKAIAEVLPDAGRLRREITLGKVRRDMRLRDAVVSLRTRMAPSLALASPARGGTRQENPAIEVPHPILDEEARELAALAARLRQAGTGMGARRRAYCHEGSTGVQALMHLSCDCVRSAMNREPELRCDPPSARPDGRRARPTASPLPGRRP